ncbi:MAG TPA: Grx4 family monothiol glutaredoxin [Myxococcota bacterium]|jgi:monothiol glutaredoxin
MTDLNPELRQKIASLIAANDVVLFMKGTRDAPRCGFSAAVVEMLDGVVPSYHTVDVLADPDLREGIKIFSDWPTIPQLYVKGDFVGGADVAKEMFATGELQKLLGVTVQSPQPVAVTLTPAAAKVLLEARAGEPVDNRFLRLAVSRHFQHQLGFSAKESGDSMVTSEGIDIVVDVTSAPRAHGVVIDAVPQPGGGVAFRIDNPAEPARVKDVSPAELKKKLDEAKAAGKPLELFDVRGQGERDRARIDGSRIFDDAARVHMETLAKDTPIYFHCHHGGRSKRAAEGVLQQGFKNVFNLAGGIDAWSADVDPSVPRY